MLIVSCRRDFWSSISFSPANEIRRIDLDTSVGSPVPPAEFVRELEGKRVLVLAHGYNNGELDVIASYRTIDHHMRVLGFLGVDGASYDAVVGFVWPGGALGVSFPFARQRAVESAAPFAAMLATLKTAGATVDLNTHSLGTQVALEALRGMESNLVRYVWNFASAIDNESIEAGERYFEASRRCDTFYVFHSRNDARLRVWYRVGDFFDFDTALGYSGPEDPGAIIRASRHVRVINCKRVVFSHGGYRSSGEVWSYVFRELASQSPEQFVTLQGSPDVLTAAFRGA